MRSLQPATTAVHVEEASARQEAPQLGEHGRVEQLTGEVDAEWCGERRKVRQGQEEAGRAAHQRGGVCGEQRVRAIHARAVVEGEVKRERVQDARDAVDEARGGEGGDGGRDSFIFMTISIPFFIMTMNTPSIIKTMHTPSLKKTTHPCQASQNPTG